MDTEDYKLLIGNSIEIFVDKYNKWIQEFNGLLSDDHISNEDIIIIQKHIDGLEKEKALFSSLGNEYLKKEVLTEEDKINYDSMKNECFMRVSQYYQELNELYYNNIYPHAIIEQVNETLINILNQVNRLFKTKSELKELFSLKGKNLEKYNEDLRAFFETLDTVKINLALITTNYMNNLSSNEYLSMLIKYNTLLLCRDAIIYMYNSNKNLTMVKISNEKPLDLSNYTVSEEILNELKKGFVVTRSDDLDSKITDRVMESKFFNKNSLFSFNTSDVTSITFDEQLFISSYYYKVSQYIENELELFNLTLSLNSKTKYTSRVLSNNNVSSNSLIDIMMLYLNRENIVACEKNKLIEILENNKEKALRLFIMNMVNKQKSNSSNDEINHENRVKVLNKFISIFNEEECNYDLITACLVCVLSIGDNTKLLEKTNFAKSYMALHPRDTMRQIAQIAQNSNIFNVTNSNYRDKWAEILEEINDIVESLDENKMLGFVLNSLDKMSCVVNESLPVIMNSFISIPNKTIDLESEENTELLNDGYTKMILKRGKHNE